MKIIVKQLCGPGWYIACILATLTTPLFSFTDAIVPGGDWRDTDGNLIHATEGGFLTVNDNYLYVGYGS